MRTLPDYLGFSRDSPTCRARGRLSYGSNLPDTKEKYIQYYFGQYLGENFGIFDAFLCLN